MAIDWTMGHRHARRLAHGEVHNIGVIALGAAPLSIVFVRANML